MSDVNQFRGGWEANSRETRDGKGQMTIGKCGCLSESFATPTTTELQSSRMLEFEHACKIYFSHGKHMRVTRRVPDNLTHTRHGRDQAFRRCDCGNGKAMIQPPHSPSLEELEPRSSPVFFFKKKGGGCMLDGQSRFSHPVMIQYRRRHLMLPMKPKKKPDSLRTGRNRHHRSEAES